LGLNRDDSIPSLHYIDSEDADRDIEKARVLERDSSKEVYMYIYIYIIIYVCFFFTIFLDIYTYT
jgi:hypothetical protein